MLGNKAPDFCLKGTDEKEYCLKDFEGKWVVLYFYPKDNTPGCTHEALDFSEMKNKFDEESAVIIGISKDPITKHKNFAEKHKLSILLLSDEDHKVHEMYGVWGKKKNYGKEYYGTIRSTFLIDPDGIIRYVWKNVKVKGHVEKVYEKLLELKNKDKNK
jgi:peroxiredoxin Q/BCP